MRLIYHPDAELELVEAAEFYEGQKPGLGNRFLRDFETAITLILEAPDRWPVVEDEIRRVLMKKFPFGIYYRGEGNDLRILVVKHHSRHPDYWKYRLES